MTSKTFIINQLSTLHNAFKKSIIRYEYKASRKVHLVEITPLDLFNSEDLMNHRIELRETFREIYPNDSLIYISEDSAVRITEALKVFQYNGLELCFKKNDTIFHTKFDTNIAAESEYFLAA